MRKTHYLITVMLTLLVSTVNASIVYTDILDTYGCLDCANAI